MNRTMTWASTALVMMACDPAAVETDAGTDAGYAPADAEIAIDAGAAIADAGPRLGFGETCTSNEECDSDLCVLGAPEEICTRRCDIEVPNDCRSERRLCVPAGPPGVSVCYGPTIDTGVDTDDANLTVGDCATRSLAPLGTDSDLFLIRAPTTDPIVVTVRPETGVDLQFEVYDGAGRLLARQNNAGLDGVEAIQFDVWSADSVAYVLVGDAGSSIANPYQICITTGV